MRTPFDSNPTASNVMESYSISNNSSVGSFSPAYVLPDELKPIRLDPKFPSSAVYGLDYEPTFSSLPLYEISNDAEQFISKQKKAVDFRQDLITIADKISAFLKKTTIEPKISISLFQDPEYSEWVESNIVISVRSEDLAKTYEMYTDLLDYSLTDIQRRTIEKVVISIETR